MAIKVTVTKAMSIHVVYSDRNSPSTWDVVTVEHVLQRIIGRCTALA